MTDSNTPNTIICPRCDTEIADYYKKCPICDCNFIDDPRADQDCLDDPFDLGDSLRSSGVLILILVVAAVVIAVVAPLVIWYFGLS